MNRPRDMSTDRVTIEMSFDDVEFIGMSLPSGDGFTADWWQFVWKPMFDLRATEAQP